MELSAFGSTPAIRRLGPVDAVIYRFGKDRRLRRQRDFDRVFARRCSASDERLVVYVCENGLPASRLGLRVGKRAGGAVARNRIKRVIREAYRSLQHDLPPGLDILCIARPASRPSTAAYRASLNKLVGAASRKLRRRPTARFGPSDSDSSSQRGSPGS